MNKMTKKSNIDVSAIHRCQLGVSQSFSSFPPSHSITLLQGTAQALYWKKDLIAIGKILAPNLQVTFLKNGMKLLPKLT